MANNTNLELQSDEPLLDEDGSEIISFAAKGLIGIYANVLEEDLYDSNVAVNAGRIAECLELLLAYAELYEGLDVEKLIDDSEIELEMGSYKFGSLLVH